MNFKPTTAHLTAALTFAAVEAFNREITPELAEHILGPGKPFADPQAWVDARVDRWLNEAPVIFTEATEKAKLNPWAPHASREEWMKARISSRIA